MTAAQPTTGSPNGNGRGKSPGGQEGRDSQDHAGAAPRDRLALALDVDDLVEAQRLARELRPWFGVAKVGLELFSAAGAAAHGPAMLRAGVEGLAEGAASAGLEPPVALAVTVLTSDAGAPAHVLGDRVRVAVEAGCGGLVCAAADVAEAKALAPGLVAVVPGIRPEGAPTHDQARAATPRAALEAGADLLVVGRAVTAAPDRVGAARALADSLAR